MEIPKSDQEKFSLYERVLDDCFTTRESRKAQYNRLRLFYLYGTDNGDTDTTYNKIYPHIDQLISFMYSNETTKFSVNIGAGSHDVELKRTPVLGRAVNDAWHSSNGDITFENGLEWAHVFGTMIHKQRWHRGSVECFNVAPHDFGVLREDISQLSRQEAYAQKYYMTKSELERELKVTENPRRGAIIDALTAGAKPPDRGGETMGNLIISSQLPVGSGGYASGSYDGSVSSPAMYNPRVSADLVEMTELYIYDNEIEDFRIVTLCDPYMVVYDRPIDRFFIPGESPFTQICPVPDPGYFWGRSEVDGLIPLQLMRNERMGQIRRMMDKQASPPTALAGFPGITDEMKLALDSPAGFVVSETPSAKVERLAPQIPEDLFAEIRQIDEMFAERSGISNVLSGKGESGVRTKGQTNSLATFGSSRVKKRALVVEDALEKIATLYLQMMMRYDDKKEYLDEDGTLFSASQFTKDFVVKVDAHSNSPIFSEDITEKAQMLLKNRAITRARFVEMLSPPNEQLIVQELKTKIEPAEARAQAAKAAQQSQGGKVQKLRQG